MCKKEGEHIYSGLYDAKENMTNILVCDDDREIVDAIEIYLMQEGFGIIKAYDGEEAIEQLKKNEKILQCMCICPIN